VLVCLIKQFLKIVIMKVDFGWTQDKREAVVDAVEAWLIKMGAFHGETIQQSDRCAEKLPEFMADLVDDIIKPKVDWDDEDL